MTIGQIFTKIGMTSVSYEHPPISTQQTIANTATVSYLLIFWGSAAISDFKINMQRIPHFCLQEHSPAAHLLILSLYNTKKNPAIVTEKVPLY